MHFSNCHSSHNRFHRDLVINLVAATVDTVCVGSIILVLVTSKYRRTVCKVFFFVALHDNSDYVAVITFVVLISLRSYYVTSA